MSALAELEELELIFKWNAWINYYSVSAVSFLLYDASKILVLPLRDGLILQLSIQCYVLTER